MERKIFLASVIAGLSGFACIALTLLNSDICPVTFFRIFNPLGIALIALGLMLLAVFWLMSFYKVAETKNLPLAALWAVIGLALFFIELYHYFK